MFSCPPSHGKQVIHVTTLENGKTDQIHLCTYCAEKYLNDFLYPKPQLELPPVVDIFDFLSLLAAKGLIKNIKPVMQTTTQIGCPGCGITPQEIKETGKLGCPKCYEFYSASLDKIIKKCHDGATQHVGKKPNSSKQECHLSSVKTTNDIQEQIKNLQTKLNNAVKLENYEVAGVLKKKIDDLKHGLTSGNGPIPPISSDQ